MLCIRGVDASSKTPESLEYVDAAAQPQRARIDPKHVTMSLLSVNALVVSDGTDDPVRLRRLPVLQAVVLRKLAHCRALPCYKGLPRM